ncbi:MAG: hypothetical protein HY007_00780 [Candidatus Sungbacteria bacterium]|nr:hypothetical protein [Candidatus Sungbacteria bacterium]
MILGKEDLEEFDRQAEASAPKKKFDAEMIAILMGLALGVWQVACCLIKAAGY